MKKTAAVIVSILFVITFASAAFSAEKARSIKMFAGKVVSIDMKEKAITLREDKKGDFKCTFNDKTKVMKDNKPQTASDIKVGDIAATLYEEVSGKNIARSFTIFSQPAAVAPKK